MKKLIKTLLTFLLVLSLNACSSPEDRAIEVISDSSSTTNPGMNSENAGTNNVSDSSTKAGDSANNGKVETFRHTPIDTITSQDTLKP